MKISDFEVIFTSQNVFYFLQKLEVVTIARYLNAFWFFDFSLLDILPKYMNPKSMSRSLYASEDLTKCPAGRTNKQTHGHQILNVCHTKALRTINFSERRLCQEMLKMKTIRGSQATSPTQAERLDEHSLL